MRIEPGRRNPPSSTIFESVLLLAAAPWLLFPNVSSVATVAALIAIVLIWLFPYLRRGRRLPSTPFNIALLLWMLSIFVGILVTADPDLTLPKATGIILGLATWRYLVVTIRDKHSLKWGLAVFILVGLGLAIVGALGAHWRFKVPFIENLLSTLPSRLISLPGAPQEGVHLNQLAGMLLFLIPVIPSVALGWPAIRKAALLPAAGLTLTGLLVVLLVLTQSRGGWIGGLTGLFCLLLLWAIVLPMSRERTLIKSVLGVAGGAILVGFLLAGPERLEQLMQEPEQEALLGGLKTLTFRFEVWRWGLVALGDFPFTGTGLGTFRRVARRLYPLAVSPEFDISDAHNTFLQMGLDVGLLGLVAYLALLAIAFAVSWRLASRQTPLRPLSIGLLAALVAVHAHGLLNSVSLGSKPALLFWMVLGLLTSMNRIGRQQLSRQRSSVETPCRKPQEIEPRRS